ncbi:MAG: hypothetical protein MH137_08655 [Flavobacteriales bacterium]|nr:hypothetical protein [Flavobacteriales bacterium]
MEKIQEVKLVAGTFSVEEAKEIVVRLLNDKINFHKLKNYSYYEQNGAPLKSSAQRIDTLVEERTKVFEYLSTLDENDQVVLDAHIFMKKTTKQNEPASEPQSL